MKFYTVFVAIAAIFLAVALFAPQSEARIPRRKLQAMKKLGLAAILLHGKKRILFPLPLPLPLPLPVFQKHIPVAEHVPVAEPVAYPVAEPVYSEPSFPAYGGESYSSGSSYGSASYASAEPAASGSYQSGQY